MTAVICNLAPGEGYGSSRPKTYVPGPLYQSRRDKTFVTAFMKDAARYGIQDGVDLRRSAYEEDLRQLCSTPDNELPQDRRDERNELVAEIRREIAGLTPLQFPDGPTHQLVPAPSHDLPSPKAAKATWKQNKKVHPDTPPLSADRAGAGKGDGRPVSPLPSKDATMVETPVTDP